MRRDTIRRTAGHRPFSILRRATALGLLLAGGTLSAGAAGIEVMAPRGLDNPTLAMNVQGPIDWRPGLQFIDLMKMMRPWVAHGEGREDMSARELRDAGYLDASGWPIAIPGGYKSISTLWQWNALPQEAHRQRGTYILRYDGEGTLKLRGNVEIVGQSPGYIAFESRTGGNFYLDILTTDPFGTGENLRNISIVRKDNADLHAAGAVFNPDWIELIDDVRQVRFMIWDETNGSKIRSWDERAMPDGPNLWGVPVEYMVQMANEIGADPWFCMPHMADEDYIRRFATYVRDNLDPGLTARVEYSNEAWNWMFRQAHWQLEQSKKEWGVEARTDYHVKKAVETASIWDEVFASERPGRLVHVLGTQAAFPGLSKQMMKAKIWRENEPEAYVDPASVFDELAITHYFGGQAMGDNEIFASLVAAIRDPETDAMAYLAADLMDPGYKHSIPMLAGIWREQAKIAHENGLGLVAYEGGQHVHHLGSEKGKEKADLELMRAFMIEFVRSKAMADLYEDSWKTWMEIGDGPFMQFGDMAVPSKYGTWGIYESLDTTTLRGERLMELNRSTEPWWDGAEAGARYQQGVTTTGGPGADELVGTPAEDYLIGAPGDDRFVPGGGNDGIHGGPGTDRVTFSGASGDYDIGVEGDGYRVDGPDGSDFLVSVEELVFGTGPVVTLEASSVDEAGRLRTYSGRTLRQVMRPRAK